MPVPSNLSQNSDDISPSLLKSFFSHVRQFYEMVTSKMMTKFPFKETTLETLAFVNPAKRDMNEPDQVVELAQRFGVCSDPDALREEIIAHQLASDSDLLKVTKPHVSDKGQEHRQVRTGLDVFWLEMEEKRTAFSGQPIYKQLAKVALVSLSLPQSSAALERSSSILRKIQADGRGNLRPKTTTSLMRAKMNIDSNFYEWEPSGELLRTCKSACYRYKLDHQSSEL